MKASSIAITESLLRRSTDMTVSQVARKVPRGKAPRGVGDMRLGRDRLAGRAKGALDARHLHRGDEHAREPEGHRLGVLVSPHRNLEAVAKVDVQDLAYGKAPSRSRAGSEKQPPEAMCTVLPVKRCSIRLDGWRSPRPRMWPTIDMTASEREKWERRSSHSSEEGALAHSTARDHPRLYPR